MGGGRRRWVEAWGVEDEGGLRPGGGGGRGWMEAWWEMEGEGG